MAKAGAGRYWTARGSSRSAPKGRHGVKRAIGREYGTRSADREERTIERTVRQEAQRAVAEWQRDGTVSD